MTARAIGSTPPADASTYSLAAAFRMPPKTSSSLVCCAHWTLWGPSSRRSQASCSTGSGSRTAVIQGFIGLIRHAWSMLASCSVLFWWGNAGNSGISPYSRGLRLLPPAGRHRERREHKRRNYSLGSLLGTSTGNRYKPHHSCAVPVLTVLPAHKAHIPKPVSLQTAAS